MDEKRVVIVLKAENDGNGIENKTKESEKASTGIDFETSTSSAIAALAAKEILSTVVEEGISWADYEWDKSLTLHDDYIGQRNKRIAIQMVNRVGSSVSTIFTSTAQGLLVGGAPGAIAGAIIGTAKVASSTTREILQAQEQERIKLRQMDAQLSYTRSRVGWSTNAASIGEDL